jgi:CubicO group peptidase (beta-lactamase class C family)
VETDLGDYEKVGGVYLPFAIEAGRKGSTDKQKIIISKADANVPVDDDTVFEFASVSKTAFAYAAMKACETGILNLDTPLTKYTSERYLVGDPRLDPCRSLGGANARSGSTGLRATVPLLQGLSRSPGVPSRTLVVGATAVWVGRAPPESHLGGVWGRRPSCGSDWLWGINRSRHERRHR